MSEKYSIILKGKSISSLLSYASKKFSVPVGDLEHQVIEEPDATREFYKIKVFSRRKNSESPEKQRIKLALEDDKTKLFLTVFPPEKGQTVYEKEEIVSLLKKNRVDAPVDLWEIERAMVLSSKKGEIVRVLVAQGSEPEPGIDGYISLKLPFHNSDGETRDLFRTRSDTLYACEKVDQGAVFAIVYKNKLAGNGKDIYGNPIEGEKGKFIKFSAHEDIDVKEHDDRFELSAPYRGRVTFYRNLFRIYEVQESKTPIKGNRENIKVEGDFVVDEFIESGAKVKVKGNLEVKDDVFNAFIDCNGDLTVENGISNAGKGFVAVNGNLSCAFLQSAKIWTEGDMQISSAVLNSEVYCGGAIHLREKGLVRGSTIMVTHSLTCYSISKSRIRAGIGFQSQQRLKRLEKNKNLLIQELNAMEKKIGPLFLTVPYKELSADNEHHRDVYKKRRKLDEIRLNLLSVDKEIEMTAAADFNEQCRVSAATIEEGTIICMKDKEFTVDKPLKQAIIYYDSASQEITVSENTINE